MGRLGRLALSFCCSFGGDSSRWSDSYTSAGKLDLALSSGEGSLTRTQGMGREGIWFLTFGLYKRGEREGARKGEGNRETGNRHSACIIQRRRCIPWYRNLGMEMEMEMGAKLFGSTFNNSRTLTCVLFLFRSPACRYIYV
jgi:hypothetical protein